LISPEQQLGRQLADAHAPFKFIESIFKPEAHAAISVIHAAGELPVYPECLLMSTKPQWCNRSAT
jgi:hypothetical protein